MNFKRTNTKISLLEDYYTHFDEDHRLKTRHGNVEFLVSMKYILDVLNCDLNKKVLDLGAGTGAYSIPLLEKGYNVTSVELVKHNIDVFKQKCPNANVILGNALDLSFLPSSSFDVCLMFGPMYHLLKRDEKIKALSEAKRVLKNNGILITSYYMNEYAIVTYGFIKNNIREALNNKQIDESFHMQNIDGDLYSMVRLEDINSFNEELNFRRIKIIASDGASNYIRPYLNKLSEEDYELFIKYQLSICERSDLLGASSHLVDIVKVKKDENN